MIDPVIAVPPFWKIVTPDEPAPPDGVALVRGPGAGWGDGTHPTTRLCLRAIAAAAPTGRPWRLLDFGSGTGLLAIAAAKLGATAVGVEIEAAANETAAANAALNGVADRTGFHEAFPADDASYDVVVANILRPVLLAHADALAARLAPGGALILSGLVSTDLPDLAVRYGALLGGRRPESYAVGEWRALAWWASPGSSPR